jgi:hypothetical protein
MTTDQLLALCATLERAPAVTRGFRPGRGVAAVRRALAALARADGGTRAPAPARGRRRRGGPARMVAPAELTLALFTEVCAHEPWDELPHHLLEPLFDATRVLARLPPEPAPIEGGRVAENLLCVRRGDVTVRGDLEVRGGLVVTGSLRVSGAIRAYGEEWHSGALVVLGDVQAARMIQLGPAAIGGTLALRQGLITAYYHDSDGSLVARRIEAPIWLERGDITGRVRATRAIAHVLRFQAWLERRLPAYFEGESRKVDWHEFDARFFRAAVRAAQAERRRRR